MTTRSLAYPLALAALTLAAGCATQTLPSQEIGQAQAAIGIASHAASPDLDRARAKLALSGRWVDARDYGPARWLAEQAEVDAELAAVRAAAARPILTRY